MNGQIFYTAGRTDALIFAEASLRKMGIAFVDRPAHCVTHLLLGVPAFKPDGTLQAEQDLDTVLSQLSETVTVVGGNLNDSRLAGYNKIDLLTDPLYLAQNASITAYCAIEQAMHRLPVTLRGCEALVIGWGRIGKCLAHLLKQMDACVTVAARKPTDLAALASLGYKTRDSRMLTENLSHYRIIFNTVPYEVLTEQASKQCGKDCLKIDLASVLGIGGENVIWARGLPNKDAPESSGALIAESILRLL